MCQNALMECMTWQVLDNVHLFLFFTMNEKGEITLKKEVSLLDIGKNNSYGKDKTQKNSKESEHE
jgi:hypothetical protein